MHTFLRSLMLAGLALTTAAAVPLSRAYAADQAAVPASSGGVYTDSAGGKHVWNINSASALIWDGKPYMPVGANFYPISLKSDQPTDFDRDLAALADLKSRGVKDIIIVPEGTLAKVPATRLKRLISYLDSNDFTYGISFGIGIPNPLTGTAVKPASYKGYVDASLTASWRVQDSDSGIIALVDQGVGHNEVAKVVDTKIVDGTLTFPVETPVSGGKVIPYLYPRKSIPSGTRGSIPDLWTGYDSYRDTILSLLAEVKPGKGLRFFLDPLGAQLSLSDETDYLVPDSPAFLLEWESYLRTTYPNLDELYQKWSLEETNNRTVHDLARLIPLWSNQVATGYLYDPVKKKTVRLTDINQCHWWNDFLNCRNHSIEYYINGMADVLKKHVANVPVVYNWTMLHPIFINPIDHGGMDGIGIVASQRGEHLVNRTAVQALSCVLQSRRKMWFLETATIAEKDLTAPGQSPQSASNPYIGANDFAAEIAELRKVGLKAFFPGSVTADNSGTHAAWNSQPASIDWLKSAASADDKAAELKPIVLKYPIANPGPATAGQIGTTGAYWVPSYDPGTYEDMWPAFVGYKTRLSSVEHQDMVLVSLEGKRKEPANFMVVNPRVITARSVTGAPVPVKVTGKNSFQIAFNDNLPVILSTEDQDIASVDAARDAIIQLEAMYQMAGIKKASDLDAGRISVTESRQEFEKKNYVLANTSARSGLDRFVAELTPYIWIEGEMFTQNQSTFDDAPGFASASNGSYLRLSNYNNPPKEYGVHYNLNVGTAGRYNVWIAATPPGPETSPFQWAILDEQRRDPVDPKPRSYYANEKFGWILLGTVTFKQKEQNTLAIYVTGRAPATGKYSFGVDAILLTPSANVPTNKFMPLPINPNSIPTQVRKK